MATSNSALLHVQYLRVRDTQLDELNVMGLMLSGSRQQPSFAKDMVSVITIMSTTGKTLYWRDMYGPLGLANQSWCFQEHHRLEAY